jgi:hypothetical protein
MKTVVVRNVKRTDADLMARLGALGYIDEPESD